MQKDSQVKKKDDKKSYDYSYTMNRELTWLEFNERVLMEAATDRVPPLERLKFVSIFCSNLDEFFMVRVGSLYDEALIGKMDPKAIGIDNKSGMTPEQQLTEIYKRIPGMLLKKQQIYEAVMQELKRYQIEDLAFDDLSEEEQELVDTYFSQSVYPLLSPQVIGVHHPVPRFVSKALYITCLLKTEKKTSIGFIPVPQSLKPYFMIPGEANGHFIRLEEIIRHYANEMFGSYEVAESCVISVTRNADIQFDDEKYEEMEDDYRSRVSVLLKQRRNLDIVRLELDRQMSEEFHNQMRKRVVVANEQVYYDSVPLNMKYAFSLIGDLPERVAEILSYPEYKPVWPSNFEKKKSIIEQIRKRDKMLYYPFDSVDPFCDLLNEAADREDVVSIKITIYRLASTSRIARILCRAAENGKQVLAMMELRARFDEENNIQWSKVMEEAGCEIIYGVESYKCHSKICLITLRENGQYKYITQIGTGNYNEKTNAQYTDISLMTANQQIGEDGNTFFRNMLISNLDGKYKELAIAPRGILPMLEANVDEQIAKGRDGFICIKANGVTERRMIDKLSEASNAGVEIRLIIRGITCICQKVPGHTENITTKRIVGRYLEHPRIYCFGRGEEAKLYISSADLMTRNLRKRIEIACPVYDKQIREQLLWILDKQWEDDSENGGFSAQEEFMKRSIHEIGKTAEPEDTAAQEAAPEKKEEPEKKKGFFARLFGRK